MDLSTFSNSDFNRGRSKLVEMLWRLVSGVFFQSPFFPGYGWKRFLLRCFGAQVGKGVLVKPRVTITFPWKLVLGEHVWIGEEAWLDSLGEISVGEHVCISQRVYLCTGNHDYKSSSFDLRVHPVRIESGAWLAAGSMVGPGVTVGSRAVLGLGGVATSDLEPNGVYQGNPARKVKER